MLKAAIGKKNNTHRLDDLIDDFADSVKRELDEDLPSWIVARIKELAKIDPGSTAFRYSENRDKTAKKGPPVYIAVDGEFYVDLLYLQSTMKALNTAITELCNKMGVHSWY